MIKYALLATMLATPVAAQSTVIPCQPYEDIVAALGDGWGEVAIFRGLSQKGLMVEFYMGPQDTFTVISVLPSMEACVIIAGANMEVVSK